MIKTALVSSLEKIFPQSEGNFTVIDRHSMLIGEKNGFQLAVFTGEPLRFEVKGCRNIKLSPFNVYSVPSELPYYKDHDDDILDSPDGYYPDYLRAADEGEIEFVNGGWCSVWFEIEGISAGTDELEIQLFNQANELKATERLTVKVINACLPEQELIYTNWFHCDCLATWYKVDVFSEEHWRIIESFMKTAAEHSSTMILTPLFTPPLDTEEGGERPTVQLVDVTVVGDGEYSFGFEKLHRWFETASRNGIKYFELSHLFTQWGARHAPKIVDVNGKLLFGWKTPAGGEKYRSFLTQFAAALKPFLEKEGVKDYCWIHTSDEPNSLQVRSYARAARLLAELFPDYRMFDALSDYKFYKKGLVRTPVPSVNHADDFYGKVQELWAYYCCGQYVKTVNRFMAMPSYRNRNLGLQLFKYRCEGFLQWGYNFWYSQYSKREINPFEVTAAGKAFPSGDAFVVYPGENGEPLCSLRLKVLRDAFQDLRALRLLESKIGYEKALEAVENTSGEPLGFMSYERGIEPMLNKRERVNELIEQNL